MYRALHRDWLTQTKTPINVNHTATATITSLTPQEKMEKNLRDVKSYH